MSIAIGPAQKVLFVGDSITDCGRRGEHAPLGQGYVRCVDGLVAARYPAHGLTVLNEGIGGNTIRDLAGRWSDDVIRHHPDWLSVKIGINDLTGYRRNNPQRNVSPGEFAELYDCILDRAKRETDAGFILADPFYISTDRSPGSVLDLLPQYIATVEKMAGKYNARRVRTHEMFQEQLKCHAPDRFCPEPIHPNLSGHLLIAYAWLQAVDW